MQQLRPSSFCFPLFIDQQPKGPRTLKSGECEQDSARFTVDAAPAPKELSDLIEH